jgi:putative ABC transport system ATP-binding protein
MSSTDTLTSAAAALPATALAVRAEGATKVYGSGHTAVRALDGVTLQLPAGRFTAIMGPSGSGKSTLMHCMAGLDSLTSGRVLLGEVDLGRLSDKQLTRLRRDRIGFVFHPREHHAAVQPGRAEAGQGLARRGHRHRRAA